jgi:hypothetical protein
MIIFESPLTPFEESTNFEAAGPDAKFGSNLKVSYK